MSPERMLHLRAGNTRSGFTLVELMVATGITLVLAALLLSITAGIMTSWNNSRGRLVSSNQAKLGLDQLTDDLQSLVLRSDGNVWLAATVTGTQPSAGDAGMVDEFYSLTTGARCKPPMADSYLMDPDIHRIEDMRFGHVGVWLRFFSHQSSANTSTDNVSAVRALSYMVTHIPVGANVASGRRYFLCRSAVRAAPVAVDEETGNPASGSVFTTGYNIVGNNAYNTPGSGNSGFSEPGSIRRPDKNHIVGNDVIDFGIRIYCRNSTGELVERFPMDRTQPTPPAVWAFVATTTAGVARSGEGVDPTGAGVVVNDMPAAFEVMVRVLTDEGVQLITGLEENRIKPPGGDSNYNAYWWELAETHSVVYTRRIELPSVPARIQ